MLAGASRLVRRAADLAARSGARDEDRLASGLFLITGSGAAAGVLWAIAYALPRGQIDIKGKGPMTTYFLVGHQPVTAPVGYGR